LHSERASTGKLPARLGRDGAVSVFWQPVRPVPWCVLRVRYRRFETPRPLPPPADQFVNPISAGTPRHAMPDPVQLCRSISTRRREINKRRNPTRRLAWLPRLTSFHSSPDNGSHRTPSPLLTAAQATLVIELTALSSLHQYIPYRPTPTPTAIHPIHICAALSSHPIPSHQPSPLISHPLSSAIPSHLDRYPPSNPI